MKLPGFLLIGLTAVIIAVNGEEISTTKLPKEITVTGTSVHDLTKKTEKPLVVTGTSVHDLTKNTEKPLHATGPSVHDLTKKTEIPMSVTGSSVRHLTATEKPLGSSEKKILCYVLNSALHRTGDAKFSLDMVDVEYCTHVIYAFAGISENDEMVETDPNDVGPNGGYEQLYKLKEKNPNLKNLIAIGGNETELSKITNMIKNETSRRQFINSSLLFMQKHRFDGCSWEFFNNASVEIPRDIKDDLNEFLEEFSTENEDETKRTGKPKLLSAISIPADEKVIEELDLKTIAEHCDWINLRAFDMRNDSLQVTQLHSALYAGNNTNEKYTVDWIVKLVLSKDVPKEDVIIGIPAFGYCYELKDPKIHGLRAPVVGLCPPGEFGMLPGQLTYFELCSMFNDNSTNNVFLDEEKVNIVSKGTKWVTYDCKTTMTAKVDYVKEKDLAGISVWTLDFDDFKGTSCSQGPYPLTRAIYDALMGSVTGKIRGGVTGSIPPLTKILEGSTTLVHKMETTTIKK